MSDEILIRLANDEDIPLMQKVGDDLFDHDILPDRTREFLNDPRHHLVLGFLDNQLVGMASGFHYVHPDKQPSLFVNEVGVLDEYQNRGIGRKMVKFLVAHGKEIGCESAWVATESTNKAAISAYLAAGGQIEDESIVLINFEEGQPQR